MKLLRRGGIGLVFLLGLLARIGPAAAEDITTNIQTARMTVMEINKDARQLVCVNSQGRVHVHKVTSKAVVVTDDKTTTDLASLATPLVAATGCHARPLPRPRAARCAGP